ncbi:MAG: sulfotransferase [Sphingomonadaceae bacterium]|nr:sulfotransferase [Sphingomonadaceae bacterium]
MTKQIAIADLGAPQLTDAQRGGIEYMEANPVEIGLDSILESARERTGLGDFGPDDFRVRLGRLIDEWNDDNLLQVNRMILRDMAVRHVTTRLLEQDYRKQHPEFRDEVIDRPIIVVGLPRSGTTHLLNLLGSDSRLRSLPLWESSEPLPNPAEPPREDGRDPRYARTAELWEMAQVSSPLSAAMHPMDPDHFHEDLDLMCPNVASYVYEWMSRVPRWRDCYYAEDQTPHYEYQKAMLQIMQHAAGNTRPRRWVNKCPQHLEQLRVLKAIYPDATVVLTYRDPVDAIQSAATMMGYAERMRYSSIDTQGLVDYWSDRVDHLLRACVRDRDVWPEEQRVDVPFEPFMKDPMHFVRQVHAKAGLETTAQSVAEIEHFVETHQRGKFGQVVYDLEGDFGVSRQELRKRFDYYFDAFPDLLSRPTDD